MGQVSIWEDIIKRRDELRHLLRASEAGDFLDQDREHARSVIASCDRLLHLVDLATEPDLALANELVAARRELRLEREQVQALRADHAKLEQRLAASDSDSEISRLKRENDALVAAKKKADEVIVRLNALVHHERDRATKKRIYRGVPKKRPKK